MNGRKCISFVRSAAPALAGAVLISSCIYFNTMYNARRIYSEAEEQRLESGMNRGLKDKYQKVVVKCSKIVTEHPESSWVDDAIFLMGKAFVRQEEYSKGIRKFIELTTNIPNSEYVAPSYYWLALAHFEKRDYNQALVYTGKFLESYPDHELEYRVMFLAGDINLELDNYEEALNFYSMVAEKASRREIVEEAVEKSARLYYRFEDWENAAASYKLLLRKGIPWDKRYGISLSLGDCYTKTGQCSEAMAIFDEILPDVPTVKDKAPVMLGQAAAFECMDSLQAAISKYEEITKNYANSVFAAEAYFKLGTIYHEKLDSLALAEQAFSKVAGAASSSEYAPIAQQKSTSIKRIMELQKATAGGQDDEQKAQQKFMAAEIQLTRLDETETALSNYRAVVDSFPGSTYAPRAGYAIGWILLKKYNQPDSAAAAYSDLITRYPRSIQAKGALEIVKGLDPDSLGVVLQAYVDSAMADTAAINAELRMQREKARADSLKNAEKMEEARQRAQPDSARSLPQPPGREQVRQDTRYPLDYKSREEIIDSLRKAALEADSLRKAAADSVHKADTLKAIPPPQAPPADTSAVEEPDSSAASGSGTSPPDTTSKETD